MGAIPRHQCVIYQGSPAKYLPGLAGLMVGKLQAGLRVMYLNSPAMVAGIRSYLAALDVDVAREVTRGALVLSSDDSHLLDGSFDPDRMIVLLEGAVQQALRDGFAGLFATGDMNWEFGPEKNFDKLIEYEYALEDLFRRYPCLNGICQYHRDTLPESVASCALYTHQSVFINETLSLLNVHYVRRGALPDPLPEPGPGQVDAMLHRLRPPGDY